MIKSSYILTNKLIIFVDTEEVTSYSLKPLIDVEIKKYQQGFSEVVVIGSNSQSVS